MLGIVRDHELSAIVVLGHARFRSLELACEIVEALHMAAVNRGTPTMLARQKTTILVREDRHLEITVRHGEAPTTWRTEFSGEDVRAWCARFAWLANYEPWEYAIAPKTPTEPGEDPPIVKPERYAHMVPMRSHGFAVAPYLTAWQVLRGIGAVTGTLPPDPYSAIVAACDRNGIKPKIVRAR